jgi:hypothetical protein
MKTPLRTRSFLLGVLLLGLMSGLTGCIKIDMTLGLAKDGSGSLRVIYGMPSFLIKQMESTRQWTGALGLAGGSSTNVTVPDPDIPMLFDEGILKKRFALMEPDGVTLKSVRVREQGGWRYVDVDLKFSRLTGLVKQSFFRDCGVVFAHTETDTCKLTVSLPRIGVTDDPAGTASAESLATMTPFLNGMRVVVRVDLPGDIRNSTSTMSDTRRATWEWDFDKEATVLDRLMRDRMIVVFDGRQVRIKDFEKPAGGVETRTK